MSDAADAITIRIDSYEDYIREGITDDEEWDLMAERALFVRDAIQNVWDSLSDEQRRRVERLDDELVGMRDRVEVVSEEWAHDQSRDRWWWYLHEGADSKGATSRRSA